MAAVVEPDSRASVPHVKAGNRAERIELFGLAMAFGLGVGALALAIFTRKHLFVRQIAPADSPVEVT